jgi:hypothetical protein
MKSIAKKVRAMEWEDTTTYSRGQQKVPTAYSVVCKPLRIVVTCGHIHYKGQWIAHAYPIFECRVLSAKTAEEAKKEAVQVALEWLETALAAAQSLVPRVPDQPDAELARVAMRFVDRAGDTCPEDPAEKICEEFYAAMCAVLDAQRGDGT